MVPETGTPAVHTNSPLDRKTLSSVGFGVVIGLVFGIVIGQFLSGFSKSAVTPSGNQLNTSIVNQSATAQGKLVAMGGGKITLESIDGSRSEFPVSPNVNIFIYKDKTSPASASADLQVLELNKQVLVNLGVVSGNYQVTTITVLPPSATPTPAAAPAKK